MVVARRNVQRRRLGLLVAGILSWTVGIPLACHAAFVSEPDRPDLQYPRRIVVPDDIPSTEMRFSTAAQKSKALIFPFAIYCPAHYAGWQKFLAEVAENGRAALGKDYQAPILAVNEPYTFRGMEDGYADCRTECRRLAKAMSDDELKALAESLHRSSTPPAPDRTAR